MHIIAFPYRPGCYHFDSAGAKIIAYNFCQVAVRSLCYRPGRYENDSIMTIVKICKAAQGMQNSMYNDLIVKRNTEGNKMTTLKLVGSKVSPNTNDIGVININVLFSVNNINIMISLPNNTWSDIAVLFDNMEVDLNGEYDPIINKAIRQANKLFPNWSE